MKRAPLALVAMLPFVAGAGAGQKAAEVDQDKLKNAVPATEIVGRDVQTRNGETIGEIETVVFRQDGSVAHYAIEPDMDMYEEASGTGEDEAAYEETAVDAGAAGTAGGDLVRVEPGKVEFRQGGDAAGDVVIVDMEARELMQKRQSDDTTSGDLLDAGEIVGMEVDLADTESFGEVEDVMIAEDGREAVALVVDNWDGVNKQRRALPVALDSVDREDESIRYDFGRDALGEAGDFDLDQYTDDTM